MYRLDCVSHKESKIHRGNTQNWREIFEFEFGVLKKTFRNRPPWRNIFALSVSFESAIISFALGIGLYFGLPFEPDWRILAILLSVIGGLLLIVQRSEKRRYSQIFVGMALGFCLVFGVFRAAIHTDMTNTPFLSSEKQIYQITGWIEAIEKSGTGFRWQLRVNEIEHIRYNKKIENKPLRVRVKAKTEGFQVGETITIRAFMSAPPGPVVPDGYDPARRAYFQGFGAYGFAVSTAIRVEAYPSGRMEALSKHLARFRYNLAHKILAQSPEKTAGLQVALLTGVRTYIPKEQTEALRIAGLAHMLAISGLHMGLLAGSGYYLATLGLAVIAPLSSRYDVRKFAAWVGILMATGYLLLSGAGVSTQRAYIMAIIVFAAVLLDRRAISLRSVAFAAWITLFLHPESLTSAGFQMSFAAATALVCFYTYWRQLGFERYERGFIARVRRNFIGITLTSIVAGAATAGFAALQFNRIARYSLLGNLLAMPIFTAVVMPAALLVLCALPFGLEKYPLWLMGQGIDLIFIISKWVAGLNGSVIYLSSVPKPVMALFAMGFTALCIARPFFKGIGVVGILVCIGFIVFAKTPNMRVSDTGKIAFWNSTQTKLWVERIRTDRYGREQFIQRAGRNDVKFSKYTDGLALCDGQACRFDVNGQRVSIVKTPESVVQECTNADLIILTVRNIGPVIRRKCAAKLLDRTDFKSMGAIDIYANTSGLVLKQSNPKSRQTRPWSSGSQKNFKLNFAYPR